MNDERILEWLRQEHGDPEKRTMRGIAAFLDVDRRELEMAMMILEQRGLIFGRRKDGKELWFPTENPPQGL